MSAKNYVLGKKIQQLLVKHKIENSILTTNIDNWQDTAYIAQLETKFSEFLTLLGMDLDIKDIAETPARVIKYFTVQLFYGLDYRNFPDITTMENDFAYHSPLVSEGITVHSSCEHHLAAIKGVATVAYIPDKKIIGLGHINQLVDFFAKRPQLQERLTRQICVVLQELLETPNVAVKITASHDCIIMRGVDGANSKIKTFALSGKFLTDSSLNQQISSF